MELTPEVSAAIVKHAESRPALEVCGLLICDSSGFYALPLDNVSPTPSKSFLMRPRAYFEYFKNDTLKGYYHSHHDTDEKPSEADIKVSEGSCLPCIIYSRVTQRFSVYTPNGKTVPLIGRHFELGIFDCFSLVEDYYQQNLGITLGAFERRPRDLMEGRSDVHQQALKLGFKLVTDESDQPHDLICMSLGTPKGDINHVAIRTSKFRILHQLLYRPSEEVYYGGYWLKHTLAVYRHSSL